MMKIDARHVGKVIGPRGSMVKELQHEFNVRISISKENDENGQRTIDIQGDEMGAKQAMDAISQRFLQNDNYYYHQPQQDSYQNYGSDGRRDRYDSGPRYNSGDRNSDYKAKSYGSNNYGGYQRQQQHQQQYSADYGQDGKWNQPSNVVSYSNQPAKPDDWTFNEMKSHFKPSVNTYNSSATSAEQWDKKHNNRGGYNNYSGNDNYANNRRQPEYENERYQRQSYSHRSSYDQSNRQNYDSNSGRSNNYSNSYQQQETEREYVPIDWDKANEECEKARKERWAKCPMMLKNFYKEHPKVTEMTQEDVERFHLENNNISISLVFDENVPKEQMPKPTSKFEFAFEDFPDMLEQIKKQGFDKPSPIQAQMWPVLLQGEDCIGISQTGSGKTLAFLLPALIHTDSQPHPRGIEARGGPNVLVLAPTRELAIQIEKEVAKYQFRGIKAVCLYGGNDRKKQIEVVEAGCEIIIATPGRLNDLVSANHIKIESITYLVLDEADRMLDMGFEPQIRKLMLDIRSDRQTVMTSATWPSGVRRLASSYMKNPYQVVVGSLDLAATHSVTQRIEIMDEEEKFDRLVRFVNEEMTPDDKAIIFCGKKDRADTLSCDFALKGISCQAIHGNREQSDREQALEDIKDGTVRILIATDVASRGIDIIDITYVINYDFPRNIEEYVHRVGRTGRAGRTGVSLSFMTRSDWSSAKELIVILEESSQEVPQEIRNMAERFEARKARGPMRGGGRGGGRGNFNSRNSNFGGGGGFGGWY